MAHADEKFLFTSESVTEGHPDKIADQISDAVLDAVMKDDPMGRVACETLVTTGLVVVAGEITTKTYVDFSDLSREVIKDVGYTRAKYGFDSETCGVICAIKKQSDDIAMGVDTGGAGDQGLMARGAWRSQVSPARRSRWPSSSSMPVPASPTDARAKRHRPPEHSFAAAGCPEDQRPAAMQALVALRPHVN